jgi:ankyrin repeat protein
MTKMIFFRCCSVALFIFFQCLNAAEATGSSYKRKRGNDKTADVDYCKKRRTEGDIEFFRSLGFTELHLAVSCGDLEKVCALLAEQPNDETRAVFINIPNERGQTVLHLALSNRNAKIAELLVDAIYAERYEEIIMQRDSSGMTALHYASLFSDKDFVTFLFSRLRYDKRIFFIRMEDYKWNTALHYAAEAGNVPIVELLVEKVTKAFRLGFVRKPNKKGETALDCARRREIIDLLLPYRL